MQDSDRASAEEGRYRPPPHQIETWAALSALALLVLGLLSVRMGQDPDTPRPGPSQPLPPDGELTLVAHELDSDYWPCSDCHGEQATDFEVRTLEEDHDDLVLRHGTIWCLDCHLAVGRDWLRLANGTPIEFSESWRLCTQCHGSKLVDWRAGIHGKWSGYWRGDREYVTCVVCHDPHQPLFEPRTPLPAPRRPEEIVLPGTRVAATSGEHSEAGHD